MSPGNPKTPLRVVIVEDQGLMLSFLERWLASQTAFELVGVAASGEAGLALLKGQRPDIAVIDIRLPDFDGLELLRQARVAHAQLRALLISSFLDVLTVNRVRESLAEGFVHKDASLEELSGALESIGNGGGYFSPAFRELESQGNERRRTLRELLSRREQQVLSALLQGKGNREIASGLGISERTVEFHRANLMGKLNVHNIVSLIAVAREKGWDG